MLPEHEDALREESAPTQPSLSRQRAFRDPVLLEQPFGRVVNLCSRWLTTHQPAMLPDQIRDHPGAIL